MNVSERVLSVLRYSLPLLAVVAFQAQASSVGAVEWIKSEAASDDLEYSSSLIYPVTSPAGSPFDRLGRMIAVEDSLAIAADSGEDEVWYDFQTFQSDRLIVFRKTGDTWGIAGKIKPYWEPQRRLSLISVALNEGRAILLGSVETQLGERHYVLDVYSDSTNGWLRESGIDFDAEAMQPFAMKVEGGKAYIAFQTGTTHEVMVFDLPPAGPVKVDSTGPFNELRESRDLSLDVHGGRIAIGASGIYSRQGKVVVLKKGAFAWSTEAVIQDPDQHENDRFGFEVGIHDNLLAVSAPSRTQGNAGLGTITVFGFETQGWVRKAIITPPKTSYSDSRFGHCLDLASASLLTCHSLSYSSDFARSSVVSYAIDSGAVAIEPEIFFRPSPPYQPPVTWGRLVYHSVARDGDSLMFGIPTAEVSYTREQGAVLFLENLAAEAPMQQWRALARSGEGYRFGQHIVTDSEWLVIGSPGRVGVLNFESRIEESVRVYRRVGSRWEFNAEILVGTGYPSGFAARFRMGGGELVASVDIPTQPSRQLRRFRYNGSAWINFRTEVLPFSGGEFLFDLGPDFIAIYRPEIQSLSIRHLDETWSAWAELKIPQSASFTSYSVSASSGYIAINGVDSAGVYAQIIERSSESWSLGPKLRFPTAGLPGSSDVELLAGERGLLMAYTLSPNWRERNGGDETYGTKVLYFPKLVMGWGAGEPLMLPTSSFPFSFSSAFFLDGERAYIGSAVYDDPIAGLPASAILTYERQSDGWVQTHETRIPAPSAHIASIAKSQDELLVGLPNTDPLDERAGWSGEVAIFVPGGQSQSVFNDGFESQSGPLVRIESP